MLPKLQGRAAPGKRKCLCLCLCVTSGWFRMDVFRMKQRDRKQGSNSTGRVLTEECLKSVNLPELACSARRKTFSRYFDHNFDH